MPKYWGALPVGELLGRCDDYLKPDIRQQLECTSTGF